MLTPFWNFKKGNICLCFSANHRAGWKLFEFCNFIKIWRWGIENFWGAKISAKVPLSSAALLTITAVQWVKKHTGHLFFHTDRWVITISEGKGVAMSFSLERVPVFTAFKNNSVCADHCPYLSQAHVTYRQPEGPSYRWFGSKILDQWMAHLGISETRFCR